MNDIIYCDHHATVPLCGPAQRAMLDAAPPPAADAVTDDEVMQALRPVQTAAH